MHTWKIGAICKLSSFVKYTAERKTISERTFDTLDGAIIIIIRLESTSKFTINITKMCIKLMRNTSFICVTPIFMNQFYIWGLPTTFSISAD